MIIEIAQPSVAIAGQDSRWPVRRVLCVGRNYAAHAREMGKDPDREAPFFFSKPADAVVESGVTLPYPPQTQNLHYEGELVVAIGQEGTHVSEADALSHVWGYAVGNDLTRRDLQAEAKQMGRPWDMAKGFDRSAVIGPIHPSQAVGHLSHGAIRTFVDGEVRQEADLADMIWSVPEIVSILSCTITLQPGDLIMTGTPAGVGPLTPGRTAALPLKVWARSKPKLALRGDAGIKNRSHPDERWVRSAHSLRASEMRRRPTGKRETRREKTTDDSGRLGDDRFARVRGCESGHDHHAVRRRCGPGH